MSKPSTGVVLRPTSSTQTLSQLLAMLRMEGRLLARQLWARLKYVLGSTLWCRVMPGPQQHLTAPSSITCTQCKEGEKAGHSERWELCPGAWTGGDPEPTSAHRSHVHEGT